MGLQKGGYKLRRDIRRDFRGDLFTEFILPMIRHESTTFQILNTDSIYGFVLVMTVDVSISKFVDENEEPVDEFVIKISELFGPNSICGRALKKPGELFKRSVSYDTFLREGSTQQIVWDKRLELGLKQICPAFTYSKIIDYQNNAELIQELVKKLFQSNQNIVSYLKREILIHSYDLGFMMMEKIEGVTLKEARKIEPELYDSTARFMCAAAITLFLRHDVVNTDMNQGNCILNQTTGDITMIDFGLVMTPKYLIQCINSRGDTLTTTRSQSPDNTFLIRQLKENLLEFQKLQFFFQEAHRKYRSIDTEQQIASMLTFLAHLESRFILMIHGAQAHSHMKQLVEHALRGEQPYEHILDIYRSLNQPVKEPATPLKEFMKVGYEHGIASVERPQEYFLTDNPPLLMLQVKADYASMWIPSKTGKALPSAEEFDAAVTKMEAKLMVEKDFQDAIALGTPDSDYSCYSGLSSESQKSSEIYELPSSSVEEESNDSSRPFQPEQYFPPSSHKGSTPMDESDEFQAEQFKPPSPHKGSTPMDSPMDESYGFHLEQFKPPSPNMGSTPMDESVDYLPVIEEATRPDKKRGNHEYLENTATGPTRLSGGRPRRNKIRITKRKRKTKTTNRFKKQKTRKQRKRKTRKLH